MREWKKPVMLVRGMADISKYIKANAGTCLNRFVR